MEPLELKSIALLHVLKDETKYTQLPLAYQNICKRIKKYFNAIFLTKSCIYRLNCKEGTPRWFSDLMEYMYHHLEPLNKWDSIDEDIYKWCDDSLSKIPDVSSPKCTVCDQYYKLKNGNKKCACDIPSFYDINDSGDDSDREAHLKMKYCIHCGEYGHACEFVRSTLCRECATAKQRVKITCECGKTIYRYSLAKHLLSKSHFKA